MAFLDKKIPNQHVCFTAFEGNYKVGLPSLPPAFILKDNNLFKLLHFFYAYVINLLKKSLELILSFDVNFDLTPKNWQVLELNYFVSIAAFYFTPKIVFLAIL
jgi:hypothetical protein